MSHFFSLRSKFRKNSLHRIQQQQSKILRTVTSAPAWHYIMIDRRRQLSSSVALPPLSSSSSISRRRESYLCRLKAMLDVFRGLKNLVKISHIHIDSPIFRLHYSITVLMLCAFSLIVTTRQYVGNPIDCVHTKDIPEDVLNTYCWIHSTYTLKSAFKKKVGEEVAYPGVENSKGKLEDRKTYGYYQWVCFCLFFQVIKGK